MISNDFWWSPLPCVLQHWVGQQSQSVFLLFNLKYRHIIVTFLVSEQFAHFCHIGCILFTTVCFQMVKHLQLFNNRKVFSSCSTLDLRVFSPYLSFSLSLQLHHLQFFLYFLCLSVTSSSIYFHHVFRCLTVASFSIGLSIFSQFRHHPFIW